MGHSNIEKTLDKMALILEETNRKETKRGNKVTLVEKNLTIRDNGHKTLDYEV